jgi:hypothetical protein
MSFEYEGRVFDWFAVDSTGSLAMFATAGEGFVPSAVAAQCEEHRRISETFATPNWRSQQGWDDYSVLGLYVYDWGPYDGPYIRARAPACEMSHELRQRLMAIPSLPRYELEFAKCATIASLPSDEP